MSKRSGTIRVILADSSRLVLQHPTVRGDTVFAETRLNGEHADTRIALRSIVGIETPEGDGGRTVLLIAGVAIAFGLILKAILADNLSSF